MGRPGLMWILVAVVVLLGPSVLFLAVRYWLHWLRGEITIKRGDDR